MDIKSELLKNIRNYISSGERIYSYKDYTSACVLYCKELFVVLDYILLIKGYGIPKDHTKRFRILENCFPELYAILDKVFPIYQKTYSISIERTTCDFVYNYVKKVIEESKISI